MAFWKLASVRQLNFISGCGEDVGWGQHLICVWQYDPSIQVDTHLVSIWVACGEHLKGTVSKVTLRSGIQAQGQLTNKVRHQAWGLETLSNKVERDSC